MNTNGPTTDDRVPNVLARYCYWVVRTEFYCKQYELLKPFLNKKCGSPELTAALNFLNTYFEIPKRFHWFLNAIVLTDKFFGIPVQIAEQNHDASIEVKAPAIVLIIKGRITKPQFEKLWGSVEEMQKGLSVGGRKFAGTFSKLKEKKYKSKPNFERDFEWYKLHTQGRKLSYDQIALLPSGRKPTTEVISQGVKSISRILNQIKKLGGKL